VLSRPTAPIFAAESEIPVSTVRGLAERWVREAQALLAIAEEDRTEEQRLDLEDLRHLLEATGGRRDRLGDRSGYALRPLVGRPGGRLRQAKDRNAHR